ncbi:MAG: hypothetical protein ABI700_17290 [Chloroflexota bacterium]
MTAKTFEYRSIAKTTMAQVMAFHHDPRTLQWLTPPPIFITLQRDTRTSLTSGELEFTLWFALLPVRWTARHEPGDTKTSFRDVMTRGPMIRWEHQHVFREVEGGVELSDHLTYEHRSSGFWSIFTRLFFDGLPLRLFFFYRHLRTHQLAPKYQKAPAS